MNETNNKVQNEQEEKKKKNTKRNVCIAVIIISIILLLLGLKSCSDTGNVVPDNVKNFFNVGVDQGATEGGLEHKSKEEIQAELNQKVKESMINISMSTSITLENGSAEGDFLIVNEEINNFPQVVEIFLQKEVKNDDGTTSYEDGEKIYQSGMIPVGSKVVKAKLDKPLEKGTYRAIAYFNAVRENGEYVGRAAANIKIVVNN